ncbi:FMN-binding protein [Streptomyces sp. NPDC058001]|uniref:FMN-binding protein n=1 Tax=Streptomyces sp. NPDC058001 TaxID=3346300 RepID=UPI0036E09281
MRRVAVTVLSTVTGVVLLLSLKPHGGGSPAVAAPAPPAGTTGPGTSTATPAPGASSGAGRSGTFTGDAIDTRYGPVQVRATLAGGRLTAVKVLQVPDQGGREQQIVATAVPRLTSAALKANSAQIDAVSGASYTSDGYIRSLQSALDQAHG